MSYVLPRPVQNVRHYERDESSKVAFFFGAHLIERSSNFSNYVQKLLRLEMTGQRTLAGLLINSKFVFDRLLLDFIG